MSENNICPKLDVEINYTNELKLIQFALWHTIRDVKGQSILNTNQLVLTIFFYSTTHLQALIEV